MCYKIVNICYYWLVLLLLLIVPVLRYREKIQGPKVIKIRVKCIKQCLSLVISVISDP